MNTPFDALYAVVLFLTIFQGVFYIVAAVDIAALLFWLWKALT